MRPALVVMRQQKAGGQQAAGPQPPLCQLAQSVLVSAQMDRMLAKTQVFG
jgi:hypothetical protein